MHVHVLGLQMDPTSGTSVVVLGERVEPSRVLPIFIGPAEAQSIAIAMQGIEIPRPGTHDLFVDALRSIGARVTDVAIVKLEAETFIAEIHVESNLQDRRVDARPSDAIALAMRFGVPVLVDDEVFSKAAVAIERDHDQPFEPDEIDQIVAEFRHDLDTARAEDFHDDN